MKPLCEAIATQYVPIILQFLENKMEKLEICQKLGFCTEDSVTYLPNYVALTKGGCEMCTTIVTKIEDLLKSGIVEKEIAAAVALLCKKFPPPVSTLCGIIVNKYVPTIIQWIEQGVEKIDICTKLGFCEKTLVEADNGISCTMCKKVVDEIKHLLLDKKVESEIVEALSKLCQKFPTPYSSLCTNFVQTYTVQIMQLIEQGIDKNAICKKFGYCAVQFNVAEQNAMGCTICTTIVDKIEQVIVSTKVESEVIELVKKLCVKLPVPYSTLCDSLVAQYVPIIMQWLEQGLEKIEICKKLGFCPKENEVLARFQAQTDGMACTICTFAVEQIEKVMVSTKVESEVIELVKKLCVKFPAPYSTLCDSLVAQYVPQIMQWLEQGIEKLEICQKIKLCPKENALARIPTGTDGMACTICTAIVGQIEKIMVSTKVESEVIELVKKLCVKFPAPYSTLCDSLVAQYVPQIMQWLEQGLEHLEVCQKIKLCPKPATQFLGARIPTEYQNGITCDVCKDFFQWASKELQTVSIDTLWYLVNSECPKVPYLKYFCKVINEQNIETLVNLILAKIPFDKACEFIRIC